jgi:hypothetical protein
MRLVQRICISRADAFGSPLEVGFFSPHSVQDDSKPTGDGDKGSLLAPPPSDRQAPRFQSAPSSTAG